MAFVQKTTPPPNQVLNFSIKDFSGGMNNRSDQIKDNEASVVQNLKFADDTILETRHGQKYYDETVLDAPVVFIDEYKPYNDVNQLIRATTTKMYFGTTEVTISGKPSGVNHQGKYYFADGVKLRVYGKFDDTAGTYVQLIGTPITGYDVYEIVAPPTGYTPLGTTHTQGKKVINYTDKKVWYEPCANEVADALKGSNVPEVTTKYIVSHSDRLYMAGAGQDDDNVFISDELNPLYFPVALPIQLPPNSDKITGMHVFDDAVLVGRKNDIHAIRGKTNRTDIGLEVFQRKQLNTHTGFASHDAIDIAHNYLIFLGNDGNVYAIQSSTTDYRELSTLLLSRTIDLRKPPIDAVPTDYPNSASFFYNDEWHLSVGNKVMVYNYRHMSWVMYTGFDAKCFYGKDGQWLWGRGNGQIATFDENNYYDYGEPFQSLWYSKPFDMGTPNNFKQFREFFLVAHTYAENFSDIYVTFEIDYADVRDRVIVSNQLSVWGVSKFGDRYITKNINESLPFVIGRRGRNIRIKITNNYPLDGTVEAYEDLANYLGKKDGILVKLSTGEYYLYMDYEWIEIPYENLNQRMKVYQINGDFEMRGKR